ncbi:hypothetical protein TTHERM_00317230 (macronuclear) [Tetrahymena thermophila SB210]|uniref:Uncharacterized protein n=1 Tax=Tetrahymena thermophila (strain SB210) TaxID=312017 RepID=I7ML47_TETTS|nr:hypothetical protein TTHERM_00317230 [Tetrahymena thermophila SB210]EAS01159.1 hypothetical protein TTHERM_00317230 [Tetrahymena thermophila SB210]|eukprot:XP_001021404.1 hypothetical protein TTHERM_00317230 [Tetrahymena thermophila SB210]
MSQQEEQKQSDVVQQNSSKDQKFDLSFVHISTDLDNKKVTLEPVLRTEAQDKNGQKKCKLFKINQGKQLIYNCLSEIFKHNKDKDTSIQQIDVTFSSKTTASYMLIQALADLQFNEVLTIKSTTDQTTGTSYGVDVTVTFTPKI